MTKNQPKSLEADVGMKRPAEVTGTSRLSGVSIYLWVTISESVSLVQTVTASL